MNNSHDVLASAAVKRDEPVTEAEFVTISVNRIQLILAEKRTTLSVLRTGIAVVTLPLSVLTFLIAFSQHYDFWESYPLLIPILVVCTFLFGFGYHLIMRSLKKLKVQDQLIDRIKHDDPTLRKLFQEMINV